MDNLKAGCEPDISRTFCTDIRSVTSRFRARKSERLQAAAGAARHDFAGRVRHLSQGLGPDSRDARIRRALLINSILVYFFLRPPRNQRFYSV